MKSLLSLAIALSISIAADAQIIKTVDLNLPQGAKPLELIRVEAGQFTYGSDASERGRFQEGEWFQHTVTIGKDFFLARYETTQAQWIAVMGINPATFTASIDNPVESIRYNDIQEFIAKLNQRGIGTFRLPTEAEWEYGARAGTQTRFSFGDALECADENGLYCDTLDRYMWWSGNNTRNGNPNGTKPVGQKRPNPWGFYDIHGNVDEYCHDWWQDPFVRGPQIDPQGPSTGTTKVVRSGWYALDARYCRVADRFYSDPNLPSDHIGFRLLLEAGTTSGTANWMLLQ